MAGWILELDRGHAYPYEGNYSTYLETKAARMKVEGQRDAKLRRRLEQELEWVRSSPRARQAKSRARLDRYEQMAAEAAVPDQAGLRGDPDPARSPAGQPGGPGRSPGQGVRGPDADRGAQLQPAAERHRRGHRPERGGQDHLAEDDPRGGAAGRRDDQGRGDGADLLCRPAAAGIDPGKTVWEVISGGEAYIRAGRAEIPSRAYVAAFGFKGSDQQKPAGLMSGGERGRVNLALHPEAGRQPAAADEPANDLDVETLASLERRAGRVPGCAVITSHDRWFLDRVATHILAWEGGATWFWFEGNFASYEKNKTGGSATRRPARTGSPTAS